jgi:hypothetical protein
MLAHRSISDWSGMIEVCELMPPTLARQAPVRQQRAFAYNRRSEAATAANDDDAAAEDRSRAVSILTALQKEQGPTPETSGLLGRIYKTQWLRARERGDATQAKSFLRKALDAYRQGFYADWREVYPGINTVTLLEADGGVVAQEEKAALIPVVRFAAEQRLRAASADYWDHATVLEVLLLMRQDDEAEAKMDDVWAAQSENWQTQTTADNLRIIESVRRERGEDTSRLQVLIASLG